VGTRRPRAIENLLLKPYFWRRPSQVVRRLAFAVRAWPEPPCVRLPWGLTLECYPGETVGESVVRTGIFEMTTTEVLVRLIEPGETALDVGANLGYMTSLLACAVGSAGRVIAYEPNPLVFQRLTSNAEGWGSAPVGTIVLRNVALSDHAGTASLMIPQGGSEYAALGTRPPERAGDGPYTIVEVETVTLDAELEHQSVGVLKLDVEDHEPAALAGARGLLDDGRIRDVLFEDHNPYPSETTAVLERHGYALFDLTSRARGVALRASDTGSTHASWDAPMRLATRDPGRALNRLARPGWLSLRHPRRWQHPTGL
jgi:FkbM family methyltransferase